MLKVFYLLLPPWIIVYYLWTTLPTRLVAIVWFGTLYLLAGVFIATKGKRVLFVLSRDPWIVLLIILSGLSCFWTVDLSITFASFRSLVVQYILVGYLAATYSTRKIISFISKTLCFTGILSLIYIIFIPSKGLTIGQHGGVTWGGVFPHQSVLGATMALGAVSLIYSFAIENERIRSILSRIGILLAAFICLYLLFLCGAKTAPVAFLASFTILPFFFLKQIKGMGFRNLTFVSLVYIFLVGIPLIYFSKDLIIIDILGRSPTLSGRSYLWNYLFSKFLERPFGYGLEAFWHSEALVEGAVAATDYSYGNSHSSYYDLLIGLGFPGIALLVICVATVVKKTIVLAFRHNRIEFRWALQVIIILLIASYSDSFIGFLKPRTIGWFIFCLISLTSSLELARLKKPELSKYPRTYSEVKALLQARQTSQD